MFYTYLWRSLLFPCNIHEVIAEGKTEGPWTGGGAWNWHPLAAPEDWASPDQQNSMVGSVGDSVLAGAIAKSKAGILEGIDTSTADEAIRRMLSRSARPCTDAKA